MKNCLAAILAILFILGCATKTTHEKKTTEQKVDTTKKVERSDASEQKQSTEQVKTEKVEPKKTDIFGELQKALEYTCGADFKSSYNEFENLLLKNISSSDAEYYLCALINSSRWGIYGVDSNNLLLNSLAKVLEMKNANQNVISLAKWTKANILLSRGKTTEAESIINELGFIKDWFFIGPFNNEGEQGFNTSFPPESELNFSKEYQGKQGTNRWFTCSAKPLYGFVDLSFIFRTNTNSTAYLLGIFESEGELPITIRTSSDDAIKLWLNGIQVMQSDTYREYNFDQDVHFASLRNGVNVLLLKVCQKKGNWHASVRLTDIDGKPLKNFKFVSDIKTASEVLKNYSISSGSYSSDKTFDGKSYLEKIVDKNPLDVVSVIKLVSLYNYKKCLDENDRRTEQMLKKLVDAYPDNHILNVICTFNFKNRNDRLFYLNKAIEIAKGEDVALAYFLLGTLYGKSEKQKELEEKYEEWGEHIEDEYLEGSAESFYIPTKEYEYLKKAVSQRNDFLLALMALAEHFFKKGGVWLRESETIYKKLYADNPWNVTLRRLNYSFIKRNKTNALEYKKEQLLYDFTDNDTRKAVINELIDFTKLDEAQEETLKILKANPYDYTAYEIIAQNKKMRKDFSGSIEALKSALLISPENSEILKQLGDFYLILKNKDEALKYWNLSLKFKPNQPDLQKHIRTIFVQEEFWTPYAEDLTKYIQEATSRKDWGESNAVYVLRNKVVKVNPNGTSNTFVQYVIKILTERGAMQFNSLNAFSTFYDAYYTEYDGEVKTIKQIKPDGNVIEGKKSPNRPYGYFENVRPGDVVVFEAVAEEKSQPRYKEYFGLIAPMQEDEEQVLLSSFTLLSPKNKNIYWAQYGFVDEPEEKTIDDLIVRTWKTKNIPRIIDEPLMPHFIEIAPQLHFSTFKDWNEVAQWYWGILKDQLESDEELDEEIQKLSQSAKDKDDLILKVYEFIVSNINYKALDISTHAYKPTKAYETLANKYGDCKDVSALMKVIFEKLNIECDFVLVRTKPSGKIQTKIPSMRIFDHAISYVPDGENTKGIFLDGTARYCGAKELPDMDQGAFVFIITKDGQEGYATYIPYSPPEDNHERISLDIELKSDCSAVINYQNTSIGQKAFYYRYTLQKGANIKDALQKFLNDYPSFSPCSIKDGDYDTADLDKYNEPAEFKVKFNAPNFARQESSSKITFRVSPISLKLTEYVALSSRKFDIVSDYKFIDEIEITIKIPDDFNFSKIPENSSLKNKYGTFEINFKKIDEATLKIHKKFISTAERIPPSDYEEYRNFILSIDKIEDDEVVIEK